MNKLSRILISLLVIIMMACVVSADPITIDIVGFGSVHLTDGFNSYTLTSNTELGVTQTYEMNREELLTVTATPDPGYSTTFPGYSDIIDGAQVIHIAFNPSNVITGVSGNYAGNDFTIHWTQSLSGQVTIRDNGISKTVGTYGAGPQTTTFQSISYGNHNICVNSACINKVKTASLGLVSDTISVSHNIYLRRTIPIEVYNPLVVPDTAPMDAGYIINIAGVPLDHLPSGGSSNRISDSELVLLFAQLNDYPGTGTMKLSFWNKDTQQLLYTNTMNVPACAGNCGWEYWNWWGFL